MDFEWHSEKAASNLRKHGVSFKDATTVFGDPLALPFNEPDHSVAESGVLTFGVSSLNRILVVSHPERGGALRMISARQTTRRERRIYEDG